MLRLLNLGAFITALAKHTVHVDQNLGCKCFTRAAFPVGCGDASHHLCKPRANQLHVFVMLWK